MMKKLFGFILSVLIPGIAIYVVFTAVGIYEFSRHDDKEISDVIIVLGAGLDGDEISNVFKERINHAVNLYEEGYAHKIIITGGMGEGSMVADSAVAKEYAVECGVPSENILTEESSTITQENIEFSKIIMDENGFESAIIVSDPLHMKRAMRMCEDYGINACSSPTQTSAYKSFGKKIPFLAREAFYYIGYLILGQNGIAGCADYIALTTNTEDALSVGR